MPKLPDVVSDTSESAGSSSDSDHSSDVAIVEPVDQAPAVIPCAADLFAASDFTPHPSELLCGLVHGSTPLRPRLMAVCAHLRIGPQLLEHTQIPELRTIVQIRVPLAGAPRAPPSRSNLTSNSLLQAGWPRSGAPNAPGAGSTSAGGTAGLPVTAADHPTTLRLAPPCR